MDSLRGPCPALETPGDAATGSKPQESGRVPLRKPKHGRGQLRSGNPGNKGGGRPRNELRAQMREVAGAAADEMLRRLREPAYLAGLQARELRALMAESMKISIGTPVQMKVDSKGATPGFGIAVIGPRPVQPVKVQPCSDRGRTVQPRLAAGAVSGAC